MPEAGSCMIRMAVLLDVKMAMRAMVIKPLRRGNDWVSDVKLKRVLIRRWEEGMPILKGISLENVWAVSLSGFRVPRGGKTSSVTSRGRSINPKVNHGLT